MKINLNGVAINYVERGSPQGVPVVFIHGFPFSHEMWEPQMRALPNTYRAIAYDIRGHGQSDVADGQYTIEFFVDDLIAILNHLVIEKAIICGLSMGGYIALRAFERHPERISGLVLCDTKCEADTNDGKVRRSATLKSVKKDGVPQFADGFVRSIFAPKTFESNPDAIEKIRTIINSNPPLGVAGTVLALACRTDTSAVLPTISVPTLILCGEVDALTPPKDSEFMHKQIKGSTLHLISSAGHMSNLENPVEFNERLTAFLKTFH